MEFSGAFLGHVGFDELKKHCRQGDEFCKEVLSIMSDRASYEMIYAKSLKRLSQRLSKANSTMMSSPLSTLWKVIQVEMDKEADVHRNFSATLLERCVKHSTPAFENQSKARKNLELNVESTSKILSDRLLEHNKLKKRHHQLSKEQESLSDQLEGARPKTKNDESKLAQKQSKNEVFLKRTNDEYYESLIEVQRRHLDWEAANRLSCIKIQELERNKMDLLCRISMLYSSSLTNVSQQLVSSCEQMKKQSSGLDPDGEIRIVAQNRGSAKYQSEFMLCDYYGENLKNSMSPKRRASSLGKPLEKFLGDLQKERAHYDGMNRLMEAQSSRATEEEKTDMEQKLSGILSMITFLDVNRFKLQNVIATSNGTSVDPHPLAGAIQQHYDKQGIVHSFLKLPSSESQKSDDVFPVYATVDRSRTRNHTMQRSQSETPRTMDDIGIGRAAIGTKSHSFKSGTLTAKQIQALGYGTPGSRKQAPAPPVQIYSDETPSKSTCVAKYRYDSRQPDELTIYEGDVINIHEKCDDDWWKGELNGTVGIFPAIYVEMVP